VAWRIAMQFITLFHYVTSKIAMRTYESFNIANLETGVQHVPSNLTVSTIGATLFELRV
jgi:hypothetical protein